MTFVAYMLHRNLIICNRYTLHRTAMAKKGTSKRLAIHWRDEEGAGTNRGAETSDEVTEEGGTESDKGREGEVGIYRRGWNRN